VFAECQGELLAQSLVVFGESSNSVVRGLEPPEQGRVGTALAFRDRRCRRSTMSSAESFDLGA